MACHPARQLSAGHTFLLRALVAAVLTTAVFYLGGAFLTLSWDFRSWPLDIRTSLAVMDLFLGGIMALAAGASALPEA